MTKFKTMKFLIKSDSALSLKIQTRLFELGYYWQHSGDSKYKNYQIHFLHTNNEGEVSFSQTSLDNHTNVNFSTYEDIKAQDMSEERRIIVGGVTMEKEEYKFTFQEAIELSEKEGRIFNGEKMSDDTVLYYDTFQNRFSLKNIKEGVILSLKLNSLFVCQMFKEYKPKPKEVKIISWFRPKTVWNNGAIKPSVSIKVEFQKNKSDFDGQGYKVVSWDEIPAPENYEGLKDD